MEDINQNKPHNYQKLFDSIEKGSVGKNNPEINESLKQCKI